ncbi:hypothetical protein J3B02_001321 [Coemansia erecta]|uniref:5-oxoprolinase n=1 Tax=Coemansia asiatica TaxID=1052880 RepID=A0A9W7XIZ0_9FUNG|nr:hypothetical protein LPJ64_004803 [Coemansia asiatica]KAJ2856936.1 hypothetical protein J3B02_001321 [Coemansia erecta]
MNLATKRLLPSELEGSHAIRVCIDRGGTFTDCVATFPVSATKDEPAGERTVVIKLLSEDPAHYDDAPREGMRRILEAATGRPHPRSEKLDTSNVAWVRMGTTVATNALLERKGERCALITTRGFGDLLKIGNQARPRIFDLAIKRPGVVYEEVIELDERVVLDPQGDKVGVSGERLRVAQLPDWAMLQKQLDAAFARGIRSAAVCLMHAYTFAPHERQAAEIACKAGFTHVTLSSELAPIAKIVPRAQSTAADAYLTPGIRRYVAGFERGLGPVRVEFMQSDGGLAPAHAFSGLRAILSGPAGGVVGYAATAYSPAAKVPVIGFDMGGTSTDVSRYDGRLEHVMEAEAGGVTIAAPQLAINTVAAGGGSRLFFRSGLLAVGPESAGAHPGPACYRKGGELALTDANLVLGRLRSAHFPSIFGPNEDEPLDMEAPRRLFEQLAQTIAASNGAASMTVEALAIGFVHIANEAMCRPIRALTEAKGHAPQDHALACFGGAGGQHACAVAARLGIRRVFVHRLASVLSAHGLALAEIAHEEQAAAATTWTFETHSEILSPRLQALETAACDRLVEQGYESSSVSALRFLHLRYEGTDAALMVPEPADGDYAKTFEAMHKHEFGFVLQDRKIAVDDIRVRATAAPSSGSCVDVYAELKGLSPLPVADPASHPAFVETASVYFDDGFHETPVLRLGGLAPGSVVSGPAIVLDRNSTVLVEPGWTATATSEQLVLDHINGKQQVIDDDKQAIDEPDPVRLAVFAHRFMGIAEHMGRALEKTSVSTNIKERLDFSCALFDPQGNLVANAPHIPVHLGSMSHAVRFQLARFAGNLCSGDVLLANHPHAGGSHLPDITVITPVFSEDSRDIIFFVASRAHHADIGGISPGSMPPASKELFEEGAVAMGFKIVDNGEFQEPALRHFLIDEPSSYPGCSATRNYRDVLSDIKAQIAANHRGISLLHQLCAEYGLRTVQAYMLHIQHTAENAVRDLLIQARKRFNGARLTASDRMDDGSTISLAIGIEADGSARFDFAGTSPEVYANTNAPPSVSASAIIYCLRSMVRSELPLNQGCLAPVTIAIPPQSLLSPSPTAAVVGGNVLTSQRLCDVILAAFGAAAASQGCMNNLTFGVPPTELEDGTLREGWGYYETIAGGHGAGPTWDGQSGVHTHMTNTRITDPEILERRYPVILHSFSLRPGSGGRGTRAGGDGCIRDIEFLVPMSVSLLTERRVFAPPGLNGGYSGSCGINLWKRRRSCSKDSDAEASGTDASQVDDDHAQFQILNLGAKNSVFVGAGDHIVIMTPGGGGFGKPRDS